MARILAVSTGRTSLRNRCVELLRRLVAAGHDTVFAGPADLRESVEGNGVRFEPLATRPPPWTPPQPPPGGVLGKARRWMERWRGAADRRRALADTLVDPAYGPLLDRIDPDLVLIDIELQPYVIVTHGARNTAILCPFIAPRKVPGVPPLHTPIEPGRGVSGSAPGIAWAWMRYRAWKARRHWIPRIAAPGSDRIAAHRELAERVGFPHAREFALYDWLLPFSFRSIPVLNLNARELDFPHRPDPSQHHTGPLFHVGRDDGRMQPELKAFLDARDDARPLVYAAFGTAYAGDDTDFIRRLLEAVRDRDAWDVLISLGGREVEPGLDALPAHVHVHRWVPQMTVLEHASCAVLHAGPGSIYECVLAEVPMVLYPFHVNDQLGYAARARFHGIADVGDRDAEDAAAIRSRIARALEDPSPRKRIAALRDSFQRYEEEETAVRVVEALLSGD